MAMVYQFTVNVSGQKAGNKGSTNATQQKVSLNNAAEEGRLRHRREQVLGGSTGGNGVMACQCGVVKKAQNGNSKADGERR